MLWGTVDGEFTTVQDIVDIAIFLTGFKTNALKSQKILVSHGWGNVNKANSSVLYYSHVNSILKL